ncbi:hypothetical protein H072_6737 [Dactylellina haptotyla CBS 200.50]|uniref:BTB domain-containing protein n=1 Tax=Dactylellina haptotyla (strain CBS 200.50) TaxID=1284197 RepID=S8BW33_DACHA|nr:hypothetical protein H072_6737 [Dactylellina haptotyla CBS 200.50]
MVRLLAKKGAELDAKNGDGETPLIRMIAQGNEAMARVLVEVGAGLEETDKRGQTLLLRAIKRGIDATAKLLIENGADIERKEPSGRFYKTPLWWAARNGQVAIARQLIEKGADPDSKGKCPESPLSRAAKRGHEEVVRYLLEKGADIESKDRVYHRTPLSWAIEARNPAVVRLLVEKGADTEAVDCENRTPLCRAAMMGREEAARLLIEKGADLEAKDMWGNTPLGLAAGYEYTAVVKLLVDKGADLEAKNVRGETPLGLAVESGCEAVVKLLVDKGANIERDLVDSVHILMNRLLASGYCSNDFSSFKDVRDLSERRYQLESEQRDLEREIDALKSLCDEMELENALLDEKIGNLNTKNKELESFELQANVDKLVARGFAGRFRSDSVVILVGPNQQRFTCNAEPLRTVSLHFKEILLQDTTKEALEPVILADETAYDVRAFGMFIEYCYFGCYFDDEDGETRGLAVHAQVYSLAEKLKCDGLKKLALKKATSWCYEYGLRADSENSNALFPQILDAISLIYTYTDDPHTGAFPTPMASSQNMNRDGFRLLLAHLAATHLAKLRSHKGFLETHHTFPEFGTDVLLFLKEGPKKSLTDWPWESTISESTGAPADTLELESLSIQKNTILTLNSLVKMETLMVVVNGGVRFNIHTAAIECSGYFQRLLTSEMKEAREKMVVMDSEVDNPEAFEMFSQYCYFGDYLSEANGVAAIVLHAKVYTLAEKLDCLPLKDMAFRKATQLVDAAHSEKAKEISSILSQSVSIIYEHTYDSRYEKLFKLPDDNKEVKIKNPPGFRRKRKNIIDTSQIIYVDMRREKFRFLLASFASAHVGTLRKHADFASVYHCYPDFATDVMMLAVRGEDIKVNPDGQLKMEIDLSSILPLTPTPTPPIAEGDPITVSGEPESIPVEP